jgi:hypothetical protein
VKRFSLQDKAGLAAMQGAAIIVTNIQALVTTVDQRPAALTKSAMVR